MSGKLLHLDQVGDLADHPTDRRRIFQLTRLPDLLQTQADQRFRLEPEDILRLHAGGTMAEAMVSAGLAFISTHYTEANVERGLDAAMQPVVPKGRGDIPNSSSGSFGTLIVLIRRRKPQLECRLE